MKAKICMYKSSVLVDELGNPRLADTGLLSILSRSPLSANPPLQFNVPYRWMAPELLERSLKKANFATDVYSLTMTSLVISFHYQPVKNHC